MADGGRPVVFIVEDDPNILSILELLLDMEGFSPVIPPAAAKDEGSILDSLRAARPDLVVMDVNLRYANGLEILEKLRQAPDLAAVKVLMSSGMDVSKKCEQAGADGFLQKPYLPDEMVQRIRELLS